MKIALIIAGIGHIICGITDCMLAYMKNGFMYDLVREQ